jgi:hypothetical protein
MQNNNVNAGGDRLEDGGFDKGFEGIESRDMGEKSQSETERRQEPVVKEEEKSGDGEEKLNGLKAAELTNQVFVVLGIDEAKYGSLQQTVVRKIEANQQILRSENVEKEIMKMVAVALWQEIIDDLGLAEVVDKEVNDEEILRRIQEGFWHQIVVGEELKLFNGVVRDQTVQSRMSKLILGTMRVGGQEVTPDRNNESWVKIVDAYRKSVDRSKFELIGEKLKFLTAIAASEEVKVGE